MRARRGWPSSGLWQHERGRVRVKGRQWVQHARPQLYVEAGRHVAARVDSLPLVRGDERPGRLKLAVQAADHDRPLTNCPVCHNPVEHVRVGARKALSHLPPREGEHGTIQRVGERAAEHQLLAILCGSGCSNVACTKGCSLLCRVVHVSVEQEMQRHGRRWCGGGDGSDQRGRRPEEDSACEQHITRLLCRYERGLACGSGWKVGGNPSRESSVRTIVLDRSSASSPLMRPPCPGRGAARCCAWC